MGWRQRLEVTPMEEGKTDPQTDATPAWTLRTTGKDRTYIGGCRIIRGARGPGGKQADATPPFWDGGSRLPDGFPPPPTMGHVNADLFPLHDREWMDSVAVTQDAAGYLSLCENQAAFPRAALSDISNDGTGLVNMAGGLTHASSLLREIHLLSAQYARGFIEAAQHLYPDIDDVAMSVYTRGAMPT